MQYCLIFYFFEGITGFEKMIDSNLIHKNKDEVFAIQINGLAIMLHDLHEIVFGHLELVEVGFLVHGGFCCLDNGHTKTKVDKVNDVTCSLTKTIYRIDTAKSALKPLLNLLTLFKNKLTFGLLSIDFG